VFCELYDYLQVAPKLLILADADASLKAGIDLYRARPDKEWSLTDCISFAVMHQYSIREALTADHHFEQAGFVPLLKEPQA
jgi:uncharacterized protein